MTDKSIAIRTGVAGPSTGSRGLMNGYRARIFMVVAALAVTAAPAQWFEVTVPADSQPVMLCHNTQDDYIYCANWGGDNVTVIDGATNAVIDTVVVGEEPHVVIYNPVNNKVFCLDERG